MARRLTVVALAVFAFVVFSGSSPPEENKCAGRKLQAAGKSAMCLLVLASKAAETGAMPDPLRVQKCRDTLAETFAKNEAKGGCATTGDAQSVQDQVDLFIDQVIAALDEGLPNSCQCAKMRAAGKKAFCLLRLEARETAKGIAPPDVQVAKCQNKLTATFAKHEAGGGCATTGDAEAIESQVDAFVCIATDDGTPACPPSATSYAVPPDDTETGTAASTDPAPGGTLSSGGGIIFHVTGDEQTTYFKPATHLDNVFHIEHLTIAGYQLVEGGVVVGVDPLVAAGTLSSLDPTLAVDDPATWSAITSFAFESPTFYYLIDITDGSYHGESTLTVSPITPWPSSLGPLVVDVCTVRPMTVPAGAAFGNLDLAGLYDCGAVTATATSNSTPGMDSLKIDFTFAALPGKTFTIQKQL